MVYPIKIEVGDDILNGIVILSDSEESIEDVVSTVNMGARARYPLILHRR